MIRINKYGCCIGALLLAMGVQSCQDHDNGLDGDKYPILFNSFDTRATAELKDLKENGFMVHAYFEGNEGSSSFVNPVSYVTERNVFALEETEYWIPGATYNFRAFYPKALLEGKGEYNVANTDANQALSIEGFRIGSQQDVMTATATRIVPETASFPNEGSTVALNFEHLLACVVIEMKSALPDITISEITLSGVADNGTYSGGTWSSTTTGSVAYTSNVTLTANASDYADVTGGGILVIPESVTGRQELAIEVSNGKIYTVELPTGTWIKGNKYTYQAEIKQNDIIFSDAPDVEVWDSENATGSVIIK